MSCESRIVFLGYDNPFGLADAIPYLKNLSEYIPSEALNFELIPNDLSVEELEDIVTEYVDAGYNYIGLPANSALAQSFIMGDNLDGPVDRRWPDVEFTLPYDIFIDRMYPNVHVFTDVNTILDESLVQYNLIDFTKNAGRVYVIYQGGNDPLTSWMADYAQSALDNLGVMADFYEVGSSTGGFNQNTLDKVAKDISLDLPPEPAKSAVIHIINRTFADEYTQRAIEAGIFDLAHQRVTHSSFLNEYFPINVTLPVPLQLGRLPLRGIPSSEATAIGLPLNPVEYYSLDFLFEPFDEYVWAATCGKTDGFNDKQLQFDQENVRIAYYLADTTVIPNLTDIEIGPLVFNPRWFDPSSQVVPKELL
jgi:hypothetical protein